MSEQAISTIRAGELERRQHVIVLHHSAPTVAQVEHTLPYRDRDGSQMVAVTLSRIGGGEPLGKKWPVDELIDVASEDEVTQAVDEVRLSTVANGLRELADLLTDCRVKIRPYGGPGIGIQVVDGEVTRLSEALELKLSDYGQATKSVTWRPEGADEYGDGVSVTFYGKPAPEPEAEQEWLFTFGAGQHRYGRFVRITGTYDSARARMADVFDTEWCAQYDWRTFDEEGLPAWLTELPESEWPESPAADGAPAGD